MASQQPPARPWFRLASASRPAPAPAPAPPQAQATPAVQPRPPVIRPTQSFSNPPTQPAPPTQARTSPPLAPTSTTVPNAISLEPRAVREEIKSTISPPQAPKPVSSPPARASQVETAVATAVTNGPTVKPLPKPDPSLSPKMKPLTSPPSPLTVPPPQLKSHVEHQEEKPKNVLVEERIEKPKVMLSNGQNHSTGITRLNVKPDARKDNGNYEKQSDSEEFQKRVITVAGENKGAIMEWTPSNKKNSPPSLHKNGSNPRAWSDGKKYGSDSGSGSEEGRGNSKNKSYKAMRNSSLPTSAFMNSNVQGVNNSILYNCSYSHHDPGVHFSLSRKANGQGNGINPNKGQNI